MLKPTIKKIRITTTPVGVFITLDEKVYVPPQNVVLQGLLLCTYPVHTSHGERQGGVLATLADTARSSVSNTFSFPLYPIPQPQATLAKRRG